MKVLHLSTSDISGGAARAAYRLHHGLVKNGVLSQMLVQTKHSTDSLITATSVKTGRLFEKFKYLVDSMPAIISRCSRGTTFSPAIFPDRIVHHAAAISPDIVHLHWIAGGFMRIETLSKLSSPIVWTLHDMWPFTGGCHYSDECNRYTGSCGCCPELKSAIEADLSRRIWQRKSKAWREVPITAIAPSRWMAECAAKSSLFSDVDIKTIPNGIDTMLFHPSDRFIARKILGLPHDRRLILFGAMNPTGDYRKGFQHLLAAIKDLAKNGWGERAELLVYGDIPSVKLPDFGMKLRSMGQVSNDLLVTLNVAADVLVAPSIQDNLPNTIMEAMACETPVVAFKIGGMPDMIDHAETGWLAHPFDQKDLAQGIIYVIENASRREEMGRRAREKVLKEYSDNIVARRHMDLYKEILG